MRMLRLLAVASALIYGILLVIRMVSFNYSFVSATYGFNTDTFYWSWCAKELYEDGTVDFNDPSLFSEGKDPYFQGCFFGTGYTLITLITFYLFGVNLLPMHVLIFLMNLLNLYLMYRIMEHESKSEFSALIAYSIFFLNPYMLLFSFAVRPDTFALTFSLLSLYAAIRGRGITSSVLFSIAIFLFKFNMVVWIFVILYYLLRTGNRVRNLLRFSVPLLVATLLFYITVYRYVQNHFPEMVAFLSSANLVSLRDFISGIFSDRFHLMAKFPLLAGLFSPVGVAYVLGCFIMFPMRLKVVPLLPQRSFAPLILPLGVAHLLDRTGDRPIVRVLALSTVAYALLVSVVLTYADFRVNRLQDLYARKIVSMAESGRRVCSSNIPINGFLLYFYNNNSRKPFSHNLTYRFIREMKGDTTGCDVVLSDMPIPSVRDEIRGYLGGLKRRFR